MNNTTFKFLVSAASAITMAVMPAMAQNTAYAPGDLVLFFQKEGSANTVYANLGNAATGFRGAAAGAADGVNRVAFLDINAQLKSAFGNGWATDPTIYAGLAGVWGSSTTDKVTLQDGDPNRTLYISRARNSTGTVGSANSNQWDLSLAGNTAMSSAASGIEAQNNVLETSFATAVAVADTTTSQIDDMNPFLAPGIQGPAMNGALEGGIQQVGSASAFGSFGAAGSVEFALDLYRVLAVTTAPGQVAGVLRQGSYEGTVTVNSSGLVSFIANSVPVIAVQQPAGTNVANGGSRSFGSVQVGSSSDLIFTINNNGQAPLTGLGITADGTNAGDFSIITNPSAPVVAGSSTTFTVRFAPSSRGNRSAAIHIASNDSSNNPYDILLSGSGQAPDIFVQQPAGTTINNGGSQDFGNVAVGSNKSLLFTIANNGNIDLTGLLITTDGSNTGDFSITVNPVAPVSSGGSTTFTVRFTPSAGGSRSAAIHIASNDPDKNPYDITLNGTGQAPDISVQQPVGTIIADGGSKTFGNVALGSNASLTFTIANSGNIGLAGLSITTDGTNVGDFEVTANPATSVDAGSSTTFTVRFSPSTRGNRTAAIHIASNDPFKSPYDITLTGTGQAPDISVQQPAGTTIASGGSQDFGSVAAGSNKSLAFTIANSGNIDLTGLGITLNGANAGDFSITSNPAAPVAAGGTTTFTVRFSPSASGSRAAAIHIVSNDPFKSPYDITLTGTGLAPDISVQQPAGSIIADGGSQDFGDVPVGSSKSLLFTIANNGNVDLTGLAVTINGANASEFTLITKPAAPVSAGNTTTFSVQFSPLASGSQVAALHIVSNDPNKNPYDIKLTGSADAADIDVQQPAGTSINDGGSKDFGDVELGSGNSLTFTIANSGSGDLTGLLIATNGANAGDFSITANPVNPVKVGNTTTFTLRFSPTAAGIRHAAVHIASNDPNENPYDIHLTGRGIAPEIVVEQPVGTVVGDGGARLFGDVLVGSSQSLSFTVRNTGAGNLTGLTITKDGANMSMFTVTADPVSPVAPGGETTFTVGFSPTAAGIKTAAIHIASNDPDESPFDIQLIGTGLTPAPEIAVNGSGGGKVTDGSSFGLGNATIGDAVNPKSFSITNAGTADLTGLSVFLDGLNASEFIVTAPLSGALTPGKSTTFTVAFKPAATGYRRAVIHIASNDSDENPFDIQIFGNGVPAPASEVRVTGPGGGGLVDGSTTKGFGKVTVGAKGIARTFTITNNGKADLTGITVASSGANAADFVVSGPSVNMLAPGKSATFQVNFSPLSAGSSSAILHILSNDSDEASFDILLTGKGIAPAPEIVIQQPIGTNRGDGNSKIIFDSVTVGKSGIAKTFTIKNTGNSDLTGLAVTISGWQAGDFIVGSFAKTSLASGTSASFKVTFKPRKAGLRNAAIHILSNDANEGSFDIKLTGTGAAP